MRFIDSPLFLSKIGVRWFEVLPPTGQNALPDFSRRFRPRMIERTDVLLRFWRHGGNPEYWSEGQGEQSENMARGQSLEDRIARKRDREASESKTSQLARIKREMDDALLKVKQTHRQESQRRLAREDASLRPRIPGTDVPFMFYFGQYKAMYLPGLPIGDVVVFRWVNGPHARPEGELRDVFVDGGETMLELPHPYDVRHGPTVQAPGYKYVATLSVGPHFPRTVDDLEVRAAYTLVNEDGAPVWVYADQVPSAPGHALQANVLAALRTVLDGRQRATPLAYDRDGTRWFEPDAAKPPPGSPFRSERLPKRRSG